MHSRRNRGGDHRCTPTFDVHTFRHTIAVPLCSECTYRYADYRGGARRQFCEMLPSLWLTGLGLLATPSLSQAFVPSTAARAAASAAATGQQQQTLHRQQQRSCVGLAATRRDVVRMPSSEPMVRRKERKAWELQQQARPVQSKSKSSTSYLPLCDRPTAVGFASNTAAAVVVHGFRQQLGLPAPLNPS